MLLHYIKLNIHNVRRRWTRQSFVCVSEWVRAHTDSHSFSDWQCISASVSAVWVFAWSRASVFVYLCMCQFQLIYSVRRHVQHNDGEEKRNYRNMCVVYGRWKEPSAWRERRTPNDPLAPLHFIFRPFDVVFVASLFSPLISFIHIGVVNLSWRQFNHISAVPYGIDICQCSYKLHTKEKWAWIRPFLFDSWEIQPKREFKKKFLNFRRKRKLISIPWWSNFSECNRNSHLKFDWMRHLLIFNKFWMILSYFHCCW